LSAAQSGTGGWRLCWPLHAHLCALQTAARGDGVWHQKIASNSAARGIVLRKRCFDAGITPRIMRVARHLHGNQ
jgi:transposase